MSSDNGALVIPIVANQRQFNTAMKDVIRTSGATSAQVQAAFNKANPQSAKQIERFVGDQARAYDRLAQRIDPAVRASRQYDTVQDQLKIAVQAGSITQAQANDLLGQAKAKYLDVASAANTNAAATKSAGVAQAGFLNVSNRARFLIGNTANQVGDMAVQWEANTNPMRIMGQQLPQILGGFSALNGPLGVLAPLLGTVAAIGFPIAGMMLATGNEAEDSSEKIKTFADALDKAEHSLSAARSAVDLAEGDFDKITEIYGKATEQVQGYLIAAARIDVSKAVDDVNVALEKLGDGLSLKEAIGDNIGPIAGALLEGSGEEVAELKREIGLLEQTLQQAAFPDAAQKTILTEMREELALLQGNLQQAPSLVAQMSGDEKDVVRIRELTALVDEALRADKFDQAASGIGEILSLVGSLGGELDEGYLANLRLAEGALLKNAALLEDLEAAAVDFSSVDLSKGARDLVDEIRAAHNALTALRTSGSQALEAAQIRYEHRENPVARAGALAGLEFDRASEPLQDGATSGELATYNQQRAEYIRQAEEIARLNEGSRSSKRGGGGKTTPFFESSDKATEKLQQQIEMIGKTRSEIAAYTLKQELLNEARKRGLDLDAVSGANGETLREQIDARAESVGKLTQKYEEASQTSQFFEDRQNDLKEGLLDAAVSGESLSGVLDDVADAFKRAALQAIIFNEGPLKDLLGWGGSLFGGSKDWSSSGTKSGSASGSKGGLFGGAIIPGILHSGGIAGQDGYGHGRAFPASTWASAPRYHQGGIAGLRPGEVPAILEAGEVISPKNARMVRAGGGSSTSHLKMTINVEGANGDQHVKDLVTQGVTAGMNQVRQEVPMIVEDFEKRN